MRFSKTVRIFAWLLLAVISLVVITSAALSFYYEKAIVRYMQKYLHEHLLTELSMKEIRFSVLKGFPKATVEIINPVLLSGEDFNSHAFPGAFADTLLQAKSVSFQFDLLKLLNRQYELKKIEINQGRVNILWDDNNRHNTRIWKREEKLPGEEHSVDLRSIFFNNSRIRLISLREGLFLASHTRRSVFKGSYSGHILSGETRGTMTLDSLVIRNKRLISDASLHMVLKVAFGGQRLRISQGRLHVNKALINITGEYKSGKENTVDLILGIPKFGLEEVMSLLPDVSKLLPARMQFTGNGKLTAIVKGSLTNRNDLLIRSSFELEGCTARNTDTRSEIRNLDLKGSITGTRRDNFELRLDHFRSDLGKGNLSGSLLIRDLNDLTFRAEILSSLDLEALKNFVGLDTFEVMQGMIRSDLTLSGSLKNRRESVKGPLKFIDQGHLIFDKAGIKLKNNPYFMQNITGRASWDRTLLLDSLSFQMNGMDLMINGSVRHLAEYLSRNEQLQLNLEIITDIFNLDHLFLAVPQKKPSGRKQGIRVFPPAVQLQARLKAGSFVAGKFKADDVSLHLSAVKDSVYVDDFRLKFPDGTITGNALITKSSGNTLCITCNSISHQINIQNLFTAFNNFTQHFIVDKNIRGLLSGSVSFVARWDSTLKFMPEHLMAQAEVSVTNGELVQFEPMLKLSKYIDVDELRHIRFKTLKNVIFIKDRQVTMPEMAMYSTAFNISVSGQHSFDNVFDYRLKVLLSEVLFNKARKKRHEINEFLVEETPSDQTTIPLIIAGTPKDFDVRFDRKRAFDLTRKTMKDDDISPENKPAPSNFKIVWEEQVKPVEKEKPVSISHDSDFVIEWDEEENAE